METSLDINNELAMFTQLINQNTVTKGYQGTFIHPDAVANCEINLNEKATLLIIKTVSKLREEGLTDSEIRIAFSAVMKNTY